MGEFRPLGREHRAQLEGFSCYRYRQPYTRPVEEIIRLYLPDALEQGSHEGIGFWEEEALLSVAAWREDPDTWHVACLAVADGNSRRGLGLRTKIEVLHRATEMGMRFVTSLVHYDNDGMIKINTRLGATMHPDAEREHLFCVIDLLNRYPTDPGGLAI